MHELRVFIFFLIFIFINDFLVNFVFVNITFNGLIYDKNDYHLCNIMSA